MVRCATGRRSENDSATHWVKGRSWANERARFKKMPTETGSTWTVPTVSRWRAADGVEFELAGAESANQGATGGLDDNVAGNFLEVDIARNALELHIAVHLLDEDEAGLGAKLQFRLLRNQELKIGFNLVRLGRGNQGIGVDVDAVADLFHFNRNLAGDGGAGDHHLRVFPGLYLDPAIDDVVDDHDGAILDGEMAFLLLRGACEGGRGSTEEETSAEDAQHITNHIDLGDLGKH